jgi:hypothetical protein
MLVYEEVPNWGPKRNQKRGLSQRGSQWGSRRAGHSMGVPQRLLQGRPEYRGPKGVPEGRPTKRDPRVSPKRGTQTWVLRGCPKSCALRVVPEWAPEMGEHKCGPRWGSPIRIIYCVPPSVYPEGGSAKCCSSRGYPQRACPKRSHERRLSRGTTIGDPDGGSSRGARKGVSSKWSPQRSVLKVGFYKRVTQSCSLDGISNECPQSWSLKGGHKGGFP